MELEGADNPYYLNTDLLMLTKAHKPMDRHPIMTADVQTSTTSIVVAVVASSGVPVCVFW